jgi:FtsP/CotA-like multicopper oxidase with cupredoxin domain
MTLARVISRRHFLVGTAAAWVGFPGNSPGKTSADRFQIVRATKAGYDGTIPGPTLRLKRGEELSVRLVNELAEPTTIHWHGLRLPNAMDGVPLLTQPAVAPGASFDYRFRLPDAGTFWYHALAGEQIDRGLFGALIVEEPEPFAADRDVVLVLSMPSDKDDAPLRVNGALRPDIPVKRGERLHLRLINATAARGVAVRLDGHAPWVMAIDGQPAEPFRARDGRAGLPPGGRADLFVDMVRDPGTTTPILAGGRDERPIARLVYDTGEATRLTPRPDPPPLPSNPLPARIDLKAALRIELSLARPKPFDAAGAPIFSVRRGRPVSLAIRNPTGQSQTVHVHGHSFRLLDRLDDGWKPFWLDTLVVGGETERIAFTADNPGKWLIEHRPIEQSQAGAGVWFAVT